MGKLERVQKVMADNGLCSRRAAEQIIAEGRVKLNGHPVTVGDKMDVSSDVLVVDGQRIQTRGPSEYTYVMLNKPRGYVTTVKDDLGRKTVMELLADVKHRVYPVGRLDKDSEGLLLFTNDGDFANMLTHPSHEISKLYRVTLRPRATEDQLADLASGPVLEDGEKTLPASVRVTVEEEGRTVAEIAIREGKKRQIRRMCEAVGLTVIRLKRIAEGSLRLGMLQPGKWRELTPQEVTALKAAAAKAGRSSAQDPGKK
ncbi:MAG: pseudouridine synthase [Oscillospiraceae bacterium]